MSMSMLSTCARAAASGARRSGSVDATGQQQLITRLLLPVNHEHLKRYCHQRLAYISAEYSLPADTLVLEHLRDHIAALSLTNARALFFILLNIDTDLKQTLMNIEQSQQGKCANFFMNLRRHVIPEFMSNEQSSAIAFTESCADAWSVA